MYKEPSLEIEKEKIKGIQKGMIEKEKKFLSLETSPKMRAAFLITTFLASGISAAAAEKLTIFEEPGESAKAADIKKDNISGPTETAAAITLAPEEEELRLEEAKKEQAEFDKALEEGRVEAYKITGFDKRNFAQLEVTDYSEAKGDNKLREAIKSKSGTLVTEESGEEVKSPIQYEVFFIGRNEKLPKNMAITQEAKDIAKAEVLHLTLEEFRSQEKMLKNLQEQGLRISLESPPKIKVIEIK